METAMELGLLWALVSAGVQACLILIGVLLCVMVLGWTAAGLWRRLIGSDRYRG